MIKAVILDADGVAILAHEYFSRVYSKERGFDLGRLDPFFDSEFGLALIGKADILELVGKHRDLWQWDDDPRRLLELWCQSENTPNPEIIAATKYLRAHGLPVYMATNQERYRAKFLRDVMFPGVFDDILASCDLGAMKPSAHFFSAGMTLLQSAILGLKPSEVAYFDDELPNVEAAKKFGFKAYRYLGVNQITELGTHRDL